MCHTSTGYPERINRLRIGNTCLFKKHHRTNPDPEFCINSTRKLAYHLSCVFDYFNTAVILLGAFLYSYRNINNNHVCHHRSHNSGKKLLDNLPDFLIARLNTHTCTNRIGKMTIFLVIATLDNHHVSLFLFYPKELLIPLRILGVIVLKQHRIYQTALNNRNDRLQFFPNQKVIAPFFPGNIHLFHCLAENINDYIFFDRLVNIVQSPHSQCLFGIIKAVICTQNNKYRIMAGLFDFFHRLNAIDSWHLNVHKSNIRTKTFRKLNYASSCLCRLNHAAIAEILLNDEA